MRRREKESEVFQLSTTAIDKILSHYNDYYRFSFFYVTQSLPTTPYLCLHFL